MRIFLADDEIEVRSALKIALTQEPGVSVVGEASEVKGLVACVQAAQPNLVLLDWELPGRPTAALIAALHTLPDRPKVIVLSSRLEAQRAALTAGADVFVSKGEPPEQLLTVLQTIRASNNGHSSET